MDDQEVRLRELQEECADFKALLEHVGWKRLDEYAQEQVRNRRPSLYARLDNILELSGQEFDKGEVSGIELFRRLPEVIVGDLEEKIEKYQEDLENAPRERTDDRDDSGDEGDSGSEFQPAI